MTVNHERLNEHACPFCGKTNDSAMDPNEAGTRVAPGSLSMCIGCMNVGIFEKNPDGEFWVRVPNDRESLEIEQDPSVIGARLKLRILKAMYN